MRTRRTVFALAALAVIALETSCVGDAPPGSGSSGSEGSAANLVANGGFEDGCSDWFSSSATLTSDTTARSGAKSCRVCRNGSEAGYYVHRSVGGAAKPGERFGATAWIRAADGSPAGSGFTIALRGIDALESPLEAASGQAAVPSATWQEATVSFEVTKEGTSHLTVDIGAEAGPDGSCFLVDDVAVFRN
jgi:hypothetical protein